MNEIYKLKKHFQPVIISLIVFIVLIIGTISYTEFKKGLWEKDIRANLFNYLTGKKSNIEKAIYSRIFYTRGVAAYVGLNPEITNEEYAELAKEYIRNDTVINSMALSKNAVINAIYPLIGHEEAIGLDLLAHPERKNIVEKTIETQKTFVAGPVELVEGGIAFISYTPIFNKTIDNANIFWGITDIVIKQNSLFNEARLNLNEADYIFAMRGKNGTGEKGEIFWGDAEIFENNPVTIRIELPIGNWILAAIPKNGWKQFRDQDKTISIILLISAFIISVLIGLFTKSLLKIKYNEKELAAVLNSLDSLIMEFSKDGEYLKINSLKKELLFLPEEIIKGKKLHDIFEKKLADFFLNAIQECITSKKLVVIEYPLLIEGKETWFSARISKKTDQTVIFNAYDISAKKHQENLLIQSEQELKKLNSTKDKFFSIIAHDLRGPLGSQKSVMDLITDEYENLDEKTKKNLLKSLKTSSHHLHNLLENLLEWSLSQSGGLKINPSKIQLNKEYHLLIEQYKSEAQVKSIHFSNELNPNHIVFADSNLTGTILRNLISNAIKFSKEGDSVKIYDKIITVESKKFIQILVEDTGVGMKKEKIESLLRIDVSQSTLGTAGEKGNGLGLLLCKEFVELQGGEISIVSNPDTGSTFSFTLPAS